MSISFSNVDFEFKLPNDSMKQLQNHVVSKVGKIINADEFTTEIKKHIMSETQKYIEEIFNDILYDDVYEIISKAFIKAMEENSEDIISELLSKKVKKDKKVKK